MLTPLDLRAARARGPRGLAGLRGIVTARAPQLALGVWAVVVVICCARAAVGGGRNSVYPIFAEAGRSWVAGAGLYDGPGEPYRYSPLATAALAPFGLLPDPAGEVLWRLVNAAACVAGLLCWGRVVLGLSPGRLGMFLLLALPLSVGSLHNGQSNPLLLGLLLLTGCAAASGRWWAAAACAALACHLKGYPLALGLLLTALEPRRFGGRFALALVVAAALPFLLQSPAYVAEQYGAWGRLLGAEDRQHLATEFTYRDLRLFCRVWLAPLGPAAFLFLQLAAGAGILATCLAARRAGRAILALAVGLSCCWMTVLGPASESSTYLLLAPALAGALLGWGDAGRWGRGLVAASGGLLLSCLVAVWFPGGRRWHGLGLHALAGLLLAAALVVGAWGRAVAGRRSGGEAG